jgi:hypothetical protein
MKTAGIRVDDLVKCDVRGRIFYAEVQEKGVGPPGADLKPTRGRGVRVRPITHGIGYTIIPPHQIIGHYRKVKGSR